MNTGSPAQFYYLWSDRGPRPGNRTRLSVAVWARVDGKTMLLGHFPVPCRPRNQQSRWRQALKKLGARRKR